MPFEFNKEEILPASDPQSPFYLNVPKPDATPIDDLLFYFKCWKKFIKSLIYYLKEIALVKDYTSRINLQLINSVLFPGVMNLPLKYMTEVNAMMPPNGATGGAKEVKKTSSGNSLVYMNKNHNHSASDLTPAMSRPSLFKTKSNQSFLKPSHTKSDKDHFHLHSRNSSFGTFSFGHSDEKEKDKDASNNAAGHLGTPPNAQSSSSGGVTTSSATSPAGTSGNSGSSFSQAVKAKHYNDDIQVPKNFFNPETSLFPNLPHLLVNDHFQTFQGETKTFKEVNNKLVLRLESLLKNLSLKIKEIKSSLKNDSFANPTIVKEISQTGKILKAYMMCVERYSDTKPVLKKIDSTAEEELGAVLDDPFLLKLQVDSQLKALLVQENYGFAAYVNLQNIARDLSNYVLKDLKFITNKFGKLIDSEKCYTDQSITALYNSLVKFTNTTKPVDEWNYFIANNENFINTNPDISGTNKYKTLRSISKVTLPYSNSIHNKCIRNGKIYKKSKILKNYNVFYYVLTCNYLHEFKIPEEIKRDKSKIGGIVGPQDVPEKSYNLNDFMLKSKSEDKFILQSISNKSTKYTFKCSTDTEFSSWFEDLSELLKFGPDHLSRFELVTSKVTKKEEEAKKKARSEGEKKGRSPSTGSAMSLNLSGVGDTSLSGMYTPKIGTPTYELGSNNSNSESSSIKERNPFERTFSNQKLGNNYSGTTVTSPSQGASTNAMKSNSSTPNSLVSSPAFAQRTGYSPSNSPGVGAGGFSPSYYTTSPGSATGAGTVDSNSQHENYLKIQQEFLRQQQNILNQKIEENQIEQKVCADLSPNLSRQTSSTSLNSFMLGGGGSNINNFLDGFALPPRPEEEGLTPLSHQTSKSSEDQGVPKVFVSSNH
ncbi:hypothetical protein CAAN1_27S00870 [[Candida] anglica]|uniref:PH domain-containing protein n=1 Tax=[Candida] anglica TaxID=148631 RepID=A0ABP0E7R2_9ASCO